MISSCAGILIGAFCMFAAEATAETVGSLGKPECLVIEGVAAFKPQEIKEALVGESPPWRVRSAADEKRPLAEYLAALREGAVAGYRNAGYAAARATTEADRKAGRIVLRIDEGGLYRTGEVRVKGNRAIPAECVIRALTQPRAPRDAVAHEYRDSDGSVTTNCLDRNGTAVAAESPLWKPGETFRFERLRWRMRLDMALRGLGYYEARYEFDVLPDSSRSVADLLVRIVCEGKKMTVREIEVEGNRKNAPGEIVDYLGVRPGMLVTEVDCTLLTHRLWQSGRFTECSVHPVFKWSGAATSGDYFNLGVKITEYEKAAPLNGQDAHKEKAMLALRQWLLHPEKWQSDLVLSGTAAGVVCETVISHNRGCLLRYAKKGDVHGDAATLFLGALTADKLILYSAAARQKFVAPIAKDVRPTASLSLRLTGEAKQPFSLGVGMGVRSAESDEEQRPFLPELTLEPPAFLGQLYEHRAKAAVNNGVLSVDTKRMRIRAEADTGRLIEWTLLSKGREEFRMFLEKDAFKQKLRDIRKAGKTFPNVYDAASPKKSLSNFLHVFFDSLDPKVEDNVALSLARILVCSVLSDSLGGVEWPQLDKEMPRFVIP